MFGLFSFEVARFVRPLVDNATHPSWCGMAWHLGICCPAMAWHDQLESRKTSTYSMCATWRNYSGCTKTHILIQALGMLDVTNEAASCLVSRDGRLHQEQQPHHTRLKLYSYIRVLFLFTCMLPCMYCSSTSGIPIEGPDGGASLLHATPHKYRIERSNTGFRVPPSWISSTDGADGFVAVAKLRVLTRRRPSASVYKKCWCSFTFFSNRTLIVADTSCQQRFLL